MSETVLQAAGIAILSAAALLVSLPLGLAVIGAQLLIIGIVRDITR